MDVNLNNFLGNEKLKAALKAAFVKNRLTQAIILQGEDGIGKKTLAKLIAKTAVCTRETKPCGLCNACIRANANSHPDIRIESGTGVSGAISVDTIRSIIDDAQKKPEEADLNIYLLFVKNKIMPSSQNKLLKIMEEPPGNALFIITINSAESLLPTIRSRAVTYTLQTPSKESAADFCYKELKIEYDEALKLAELYGGNIGKMMSGKSVPVETAIKISEIFDLTDENELLAVTYPLIKDRATFALCIENLRVIFRDALIMKHENNINLSNSPTSANRISKKYRDVKLIKLQEICSEYITLSKKNLNMNLLVTSFCAKIREVVLN